MKLARGAGVCVCMCTCVRVRVTGSLLLPHPAPCAAPGRAQRPLPRQDLDSPAAPSPHPHQVSSGAYTDGAVLRSLSSVGYSQAISNQSWVAISNLLWVAIRISHQGRITLPRSTHPPDPRQAWPSHTSSSSLPARNLVTQPVWDGRLLRVAACCSTSRRQAQQLGGLRHDSHAWPDHAHAVASAHHGLLLHAVRPIVLGGHVLHGGAGATPRGPHTVRSGSSSGRVWQ